MKSLNFSFLIALCISGLYAQQTPLATQAFQEFASGRYGEAERDFLEVVRLDPSDIRAQMFLGHALYRQRKFADATVPYEAARRLERDGKSIPLEHHRVLVDQLVMAYGISGQLDKAHSVLKEAIPVDPEYPLNYYNAACTFAEQGKKADMLSNLALAFRFKDHMIGGRPLPNPLTDSSFRAFVDDKDFKELAKKRGFN